MILFVAFVLISIFASAVFLHDICTWESAAKETRILKYLRFSARAAACLLLFISLLEILNLVNLGEFASAYPFMTIICLVEWCLCLLRRVRSSGLFRFAAKTALIVLILEMTVFNLPTYRLCFGDYPQTELSVANALLEGNGTRNDDGSITISGESEMVLTFEEIDHKVGTIDTEVDFAGDQQAAQLKVDVTDESQSLDYRYNIIDETVVSNWESSEIVCCEFTGNVDKLRVKLTPISGKTLTLHSVTLNRTVPVEVSWPRVLFLLFIPIFIYMVMNVSFMQKGTDDNRIFCRIAAAVISAGFCAVVLFSMSYEVGEGGWDYQFELQNGNQMTQELVEAFEAGQVHLLAEPSESLLAVENPYDRNARESAGADVIWDHVLYDGHYYSYYGIAPVVLIYLPYHMITGHYFSDKLAIVLFSIIGIIGLTMVFLAFVRRWFPKTPTGITLTCLILLQVISGIWFSVGRPDFYENAISAGFACITWGTYFLIKSGVIGSGKISLWRAAAASFLLSLMVLCRPTLAVYTICAALFLFIAAFRYRKGKELCVGGTFAKGGLRYLACAFVPMICLAGVQMWYNMARFDSPFDFGIQYSMTINDFTKSEFHFQFVWMALYNYLFNPPIFTPEYPFIQTEFQDMQTHGFFYDDVPATGNTSGLLFLALPVFGYLLAGKAWKKLDGRTARLQSLVYIGLPCVVMPLVIIGSVWESGYAVRYMLDFSWEVVLGALAILFFIYHKTEQELVRRILRGLLCFSLVWALIVSGVQSANQMFRYVWAHYDCPEIMYSFEQMIEFWR